MAVAFLLVLSFISFNAHAGSWEDYHTRNNENHVRRIEKVRTVLCRDKTIPVEVCQRDASLVNRVGVMAVVDALKGPIPWREFRDLIGELLKAFDINAIHSHEGKAIGKKNYQSMQALYHQFSNENLELAEQKGRELLAKYFPKVHQELYQMLLSGIREDNPDVGHREDHYLRVLYFTELFMHKLLNKDSIDLSEDRHQVSLALLAALFHDIKFVPKNASDEQRRNSSGLAAVRAKEILMPLEKNLNLQPGDMEIIGSAIVTHSWSRNGKPQTMAAAALQAADRMDASGAIGFYRTLMVSGSFKGTTFAHPEFPFEAFKRPEKSFDDRKYTLDHFFEKLLALTSGKEDKEPTASVLQNWGYENRDKALTEILLAIAYENGITMFPSRMWQHTAAVHACNIEADIPWINSQSTHQNIRWANLVTILDQPFHSSSNAKTFEQLMDEKSHKGVHRLESLIPNFCQRGMIYKQLFWIAYYLKRFSNMTVQVHQLPSETNQIEELIKYLSSFLSSTGMGELKVSSTDSTVTNCSVRFDGENREVKIHFKYGYENSSLFPVEGSDLYLSLSMAIGFDQRLQPGQTLLPNRFYYLDTENRVLQRSPVYRQKANEKAVNDILVQLQEKDAINQEYELAAMLARFLNSNYVPEHNSCNQMVNPEVLFDYVVGAIGKIDGLWNPSTNWSLNSRL